MKKVKIILKVKSVKKIHVICTLQVKVRILLHTHIQVLIKVYRIKSVCIY